MMVINSDYPYMFDGNEVSEVYEEDGSTKVVCIK